MSERDNLGRSVHAVDNDEGSKAKQAGLAIKPSSISNLMESRKDRESAKDSTNSSSNKIATSEEIMSKDGHTKLTLEQEDDLPSVGIDR